MKKLSPLLLALLIALVAIPGCRKEKGAEEEAFSFVVYPGARYLSQLTDLTKQAHKILQPGRTDVPAIAIYDTDAPLDSVVQYYLDSYGYKISTDPNAAVTKPPAYRRSGDLQVDAQSVGQLIPKLGLKTDISKAVGRYDAVELNGKANRARVTIQRPYFDVVTSQVVDRTMILMSR